MGRSREGNKQSAMHEDHKRRLKEAPSTSYRRLIWRPNCRLHNRLFGLMIKLLSNCLINLRIILAQEMHEWLLRREEAFTKWMILLIGCLGQQLREVSNDEAINPWPNESLTLWVNIKSIWHIALFHASPKKDIKTKGLTDTVKTVCSSLCI